jgi:hypothetical protein
VEIVNDVIELAGLAHGAVGFAVQVNVTLPAVLSPVLGVYVVLADVALANVPVPLVLHMPDVEFVEPAAIATGPLPAHVKYGPPAPAVGATWIVSVAIDTAGLAHGAVGFAVHVNVRVPAVMSPALGVYVVEAELALPKVPVPFVDHIPVVECVDVAMIATGPEVEHVEYGPPALAVGAPWIVSVALADTGLAHGAVAFDVHVKVTLPLVMSPALGV